MKNTEFSKPTYSDKANQQQAHTAITNTTDKGLECISLAATQQLNGDQANDDEDETFLKGYN